MKDIHVIARTEDTVTLRASDDETLLAAAEDAEDIAVLLTAEAREAVIGKAAARTDNLSDDLVGRRLDGEHPLTIWREHRGMTSRGLADAAGVSRSDLAQIEGGKTPGSLAAYRSLAAALNVTLDDLLSETP